MRPFLSVLKKLFPLFLLVFVFTGPKGCGGGASSPPIGIPTPISNLINVSGPDAAGNVFINGAPGAVLPMAQVKMANLTQGGVVFRWKSMFLRAAWAQAVGVTDDDIAGLDGSFQMAVTASVGDTLRVLQIVGGVKSPPLDLTVKGNSIPLGSPPKGLFVDSTTHQAFVTTPQGPAGALFTLDLIPASPQPQLLLSIPNFSGIADLTIDTPDQRGLALSPSDQAIAAFSLNGSTSPLVTPLSSPLSLDQSPAKDLAVIGVQSSTQSIFFYETDRDIFPCAYLILPPPGIIALHKATPAIRIVEDAKQDLQIVAVSQFSDQSWVISRIQFNSCPFNFAPVEQVVLPPLIQPGRLDVFNFADQALVTDNGTNLTYLIDFSQKTTIPIQVGSGPFGVAVNPATNRAYAVNQHDHSVTSIDLTTLTTQTQTAVGLSPTVIALDPSLNRAVVLSTFDSSLILLNLNF